MTRQAKITNRNVRILAATLFATLLAIILLSSNVLAGYAPAYPPKAYRIVDPGATIPALQASPQSNSADYGLSGITQPQETETDSPSSSSLASAKPSPCVYYEINGSQGIEAVPCWTPTTKKY